MAGLLLGQHLAGGSAGNRPVLPVSSRPATQSGKHTEHMLGSRHLLSDENSASALRRLHVPTRSRWLATMVPWSEDLSTSLPQGLCMAACSGWEQSASLTSPCFPSFSKSVRQCSFSGRHPYLALLIFPCFMSLHHLPTFNILCNIFLLPVVWTESCLLPVRNPLGLRVPHRMGDGGGPELSIK